MPGSFDLSYVPTSIAGQALPIVVVLYEPGEDQPYTILPNTRCLQIEYREGPEPSAARFQYQMGDVLESTLGWPSQFEQLWPIDSQGNYTIQVDDRLVVMTSDPDGDPIVLFDGFAQIPQVDIGPRSQGVTFVAVGVAARLWDAPITGRVQRNADEATTTDGSEDVMIDAPCRFNPSEDSIGGIGGFIGNSVGFTYRSTADSGNYPIFIDPLLVERNDDLTDYWDVSGVLKYLMSVVPNPVDDAGNEYVQFPTFSVIDAIVEAYAAPPDGLLNPGSATTSNIDIRDYDATNRAVPQVFADLLGYAGIVMSYVTTTGDDGLPLTELQILRRDAFASAAPKLVYLAADGSTSLDLSANNTTSLHLARDTNGVVNSWDMETQLKQVEITVYLAPGFQPKNGDQADCTPFFTSNLTNATGTKRRMYRWYIADECGDGHWNAATSTWSTSALELSEVFPCDSDGNVTYVRRYRPGSRTLIAKDAEGKPLKAVLEVKQGTIAGDPTIVSVLGSGWQTITHGWQLLDDRLGIELSIEDPESWHTGNTDLPTVQGITWQANPGAGENFVLRLTTVIDADKTLDVNAAKRLASPTKFIRQRSGDGKDHFQYCSIAVGSLNYTAQNGDGTNPVVIRDDTAVATTHAVQLRSAHEFPVLAGSVTIPFLTDYYQIGDRVKIVQGRNASLQINVGADQGETPTYPWVTAFSWILEHDRQQTVLQLSDRRAEPRRIG
jgi:hypothetical protein